MKVDKDGCFVRAKCVDLDGKFNVIPGDFTDRMDLYTCVDRMLCCITGGKFSFLSELNDMQSGDDGKTVFEKKSDIPLKIVNLLLAPYNMVIEED